MGTFKHNAIYLKHGIAGDNCLIISMSLHSHYMPIALTSNFLLIESSFLIKTCFFHNAASLIVAFVNAIVAKGGLECSRIEHAMFTYTMSLPIIYFTITIDISAAIVSLVIKETSSDYFHEKGPDLTLDVFPDSVLKINIYINVSENIHYIYTYIYMVNKT